MPDTAASWTWWIFTSVLLSLVWNVAGNLLSSPFQKFLNNHFEQRRKNRLERNQFEAGYVKDMVKLAESDMTVLIVMANLVETWRARADRLLMLGSTTVIGGLILSSMGFNLWLFIAMLIVGGLASLVGLFVIFISMRVREAGEIYDTVIFAYHEKHHIRKIVNDE
jgi:hypothetical protein